MQTIKTILKFLRGLLIILVVLYGALAVMLTLPSVQRRVSVALGDELSQMLNTHVSVGHLTIGYPNRLILDDVELDDLKGSPLLRAARLSARFEWIPLFREGRISIHTAQVFGLHLNMTRTRPEEPLNLQFLMDAFASNEASENTRVDLRINSLLVRRCRLRYDVMSEKVTPGVFNPNHIAVDNINATMALKAFRHDSINAQVKRLDLTEQSGFRLDGLQMHLLANTQMVNFKDFEMSLPDSRIRFDSIRINLSAVEGDTVLAHPYLSRINGRMRRSYLTPADLTPFMPKLRHFRDALYMDASLRGNRERLEIPLMQVRSQQEQVSLCLDNALIHLPLDTLEKMKVSANVSYLNVTNEGIPFLWHNLMGDEASLPEVLQNLKHVRFDGNVGGELNDMATYGHLVTGIGEVVADARILYLADSTLVCKGHIMSDSIDMKTLIGEKHKLGKVSFNLDFNGKLPLCGEPDLYLKGNIPTLQYSGYEYQNIQLDGWLKKNSFDGELAFEDPNVVFKADGHVSVSGGIPIFDVTARIDHFRPYDLRLTQDREGYEYASVVKAHFQGNTLSNFTGVLRIDSLKATLPRDTFFMPELVFATEITDANQKLITVKSDAVQMRIEGDYAYETLSESFEQILEKYLPSFFTNRNKRTHEVDNEFFFDIKLANSKFYPYVLGIPLKIMPSASLKGFISNKQGRVDIVGDVPHLTYGDAVFEIGNVQCYNSPEYIMANFSIAKQMVDKARMTLMIDLRAEDDRLKTHFSWGNDSPVTYAGSVETETLFSMMDESSDFVRADVQIKPSEIIINDTVWNVAESVIRLDSGFVDVQGVGVQHDNQHLIVNGRLSENVSDSLVIDLKGVAVEYILDIVQFKAVEFSGRATGKVYVNGTLSKDFQARTDLHVDNFNFNDGLMGDMDVSARWDNEVGVVLDADIREADTLAFTQVVGNISPQKKGLDLQIDARNTNLSFLNSFIGSIFADVSGRATGGVHLHGSFKELNLEGKAIASASLTPRILNTPFHIENDSVILGLDGISFPDVRAFDTDGNTVWLSGQVTHQHLKNMAYDFSINPDHACFYNTTDFGDMPFYGKIYGSGNVRLYGGGNELNVDGNITSERGTNFVFNMSTPEAITNNNFITFVDRTSRPKQIVVDNLRLFQHVEDKEEEEGEPLQVFINANIDATPNADVRVIMDMRSGDHISANGTGNIQVAFTNENTTLRGKYVIESGEYKMSIQDIIRKDFQLQQGSEVTFTGNGGEAELDLKAVYAVNSASLSDLIPDATFNQNTVKVNCIINMTGKLDNPVLNFDLELPTVNDEERQLVRSAISTDEQMRMQIIYLLAIGKFYTYDYATIEGRQSSDAMSSILSSTLSGQLNNLLSQALDMDNWNFSSNFSTGQEGWSDLEVEGILSGRLLNNRLIVNGNFGYRENQMRNSNFVGDFNVQLLLIPTGELALKAYNMTNDRYFAKQTFNTQGVGLVYKREFDNWRDFFRLKKNK